MKEDHDFGDIRYTENKVRPLDLPTAYPAKRRKLTMTSFREWVSSARQTKKTRALGSLSAVDLYRFLYPNREPRCKNYYGRGCVHGYKKHFYRWGRDVWNLWARANQDELSTFLKDFAIAGCGIIMHFKPKEK